jgi:hypothetical protein
MRFFCSYPYTVVDTCLVSTGLFRRLMFIIFPALSQIHISISRFRRVDIFHALFMEVDIPVLFSRNHIFDPHCLSYKMFLSALDIPVPF